MDKGQEWFVSTAGLRGELVLDQSSDPRDGKKEKGRIHDARGPGRKGRCMCINKLNAALQNKVAGRSAFRSM